MSLWFHKHSGGNQITVGAGLTVFLSLSGWGGPQSTEAFMQSRVRASYTLSNMVVDVLSASGTLTAVSRVNGSNGNLALSITGTGKTEDTTNSDSLTSGNLVNWSLTASAMHTETGFLVNGVSCLLNDAGAGVDIFQGNFTNISTTQFTAPVGQSVVPTEAFHQLKVYTSLVLSNMRFYVNQSSSGQTCTIRSRKNGNNGNQAISYAATETGEKEDTSNSDSYSAGDLVSISLTGITSGSMAVSNKSFHVSSTTASLIGGAGGNGIVSGDYIGLGAPTAGESLENRINSKIGSTLVLSKMRVYISANTRTSTTTFVLRANAATPSGGPSVSIASSSTGAFEDASGSYTPSSTDLVNFLGTFDSGSGSATIRTIQIHQGTTSLTHSGQTSIDGKTESSVSSINMKDVILSLDGKSELSIFSQATFSGQIFIDNISETFIESNKVIFISSSFESVLHENSISALGVGITNCSIENINQSSVVSNLLASARTHGPKYQYRFAPTDISDLAVWNMADRGLYSDAGSTPAVVGGPIQQINDFSGNGYHLTQTTLAKKPIYNIIEYGGPEIVFDGMDDVMESAFAPPLSQTDHLTVFTYGRWTTLASGDRSGIFGSDSIGNTPGADTYSVGGGINGVIVGVPGSPAVAATSIIPIVGSSLQCITYQLSYDGVDITLMARRDGISNDEDVGTEPETFTTYTVSGSKFLLGARGPNDNFVSMQAKEVIAYTRKLTTVEIQQVIDYLEDKWRFYSTRVSDTSVSSYVTFSANVDSNGILETSPVFGKTAVVSCETEGISEASYLATRNLIATTSMDGIAEKNIGGLAIRGIITSLGHIAEIDSVAYRLLETSTALDHLAETSMSAARTIFPSCSVDNISELASLATKNIIVVTAIDQIAEQSILGSLVIGGSSNIDNISDTSVINNLIANSGASIENVNELAATGTSLLNSNIINVNNIVETSIIAMFNFVISSNIDAIGEISSSVSLNRLAMSNIENVSEVSNMTSLVLRGISSVDNITESIISASRNVFSSISLDAVGESSLSFNRTTFVSQAIDAISNMSISSGALRVVNAGIDNIVELTNTTSVNRSAIVSCDHIAEINNSVAMNFGGIVAIDNILELTGQQGSFVVIASSIDLIGEMYHSANLIAGVFSELDNVVETSNTLSLVVSPSVAIENIVETSNNSGLVNNVGQVNVSATHESSILSSLIRFVNVALDHITELLTDATVTGGAELIADASSNTIAETSVASTVTFGIATGIENITEVSNRLSANFGSFISVDNISENRAFVGNLKGASLSIDNIAKNAIYGNLALGFSSQIDCTSHLTLFSNFNLAGMAQIDCLSGTAIVLNKTNYVTTHIDGIHELNITATLDEPDATPTIIRYVDLYITQAYVVDMNIKAKRKVL